MKHATVNSVTVPVQVVLGETRLSLEQIGRLGQGSIVELSSLAGEPVDFLAAGELIARGEVVIIDENFGIRITSLVPGEDDNG